VHLAAHSYGGPLAIVVALEHPDLVRSLTLAEPAIGTLLADPPEGKPLLDERAQAMESVLTAVKAGDTVRALTLAFDWVNSQCLSTFERQPEAVRQMFLDNARTVPLVQAAPPPALSWATVGDVKAPTCSGWSRCPASVRTPSSWPKCSSGMRGSPSPGHGLALLQGAEAGVERIDGEKFGNLVRIDGIRSAATGCLRTPG
jgi:pimeloyl-ACP methyl ester carboxylesterase